MLPRRRFPCAEWLILGAGEWNAYSRHMVAAALTSLLHGYAKPSYEAELAALERWRLSGGREY